MSVEVPCVIPSEEGIARLYEQALVRPLPNCSQEQAIPPASPTKETYDVVIAGAGPAGLVLSLFLARYGLRHPGAILCVEPRETPLPSGRADGLTPRTLETFLELGVYEQVLNIGKEQAENVLWTESPGLPHIKQVRRGNLDMPLSRVPNAASCPQGQIERIFETELKRYANSALERGSEAIHVEIAENSNLSHPIRVTIRDNAKQERVVYCRYLIGADGAHSTVRRCMGIKMVGDSSNSSWTAIDFVPDTNFPDIRRMGAIHTSRGSIMYFPRERNADGEWQCRFYADTNHLRGGRKISDVKTGAQEQSGPTVQKILEDMTKIFAPYYIRVKPGTRIEWMSTYEVGQRVAEQFAVHDSRGMPRIFFVGDACHTHSPKLGQGMNVSIADSYNLAWKISHVLLGISKDPKALLETYATERRAVALQLLEIDHRWYNYEYAFKETTRHEDYCQGRTEILQQYGGFLSGQGIQYATNYLTKPVNGTWKLSTGCRLQPHSMRRFADSVKRDLLDLVVPDGRWKILVFSGLDVLRPNGRSTSALISLFEEVIPFFPPGPLKGALIIPESVEAAAHVESEFPVDGIDWAALPACVKKEAEMETFIASPSMYELHGIDEKTGGAILVRPDGFISALLELEDVF